MNFVNFENDFHIHEGEPLTNKKSETHSLSKFNTNFFLHTFNQHESVFKTHKSYMQFLQNIGVVILFFKNFNKLIEVFICALDFIIFNIIPKPTKLDCCDLNYE